MIRPGDMQPPGTNECRCLDCGRTMRGTQHGVRPEHLERHAADDRARYERAVRASRPPFPGLLPD